MSSGAGMRSPPGGRVTTSAAVVAILHEGLQTAHPGSRQSQSGASIRRQKKAAPKKQAPAAGLCPSIHRPKRRAGTRGERVGKHQIKEWQIRSSRVGPIFSGAVSRDTKNS